MPKIETVGDLIVALQSVDPSLPVMGYVNEAISPLYGVNVTSIGAEDEPYCGASEAWEFFVSRQNIPEGVKYWDLKDDVRGKQYVYIRGSNF
jgi:hypothetical protein